MKERAAIILAAGEGRRMGSDKSKVCCEVLFKPLICHITDNLLKTGMTTDKLCVVVGPEPFSSPVKELLPEGCVVAVQTERLGTGHAVMQCREFLEANKDADILIMYGDAPFVDADTILAAHGAHSAAGNDVTVLTARVGDPAKYGRIIHKEGSVEIVEAADATEEQLKINEINAGTYWFSAEFLLESLKDLKTDNKLKQYYLTDMLGFCDGKRRKSGAYKSWNEHVALGANTRRELSNLNEIAREHMIDYLLNMGVDIPFAGQVIVGSDVKVAPGASLMPGTILKGKTTIGAGAVIGPNSVIADSVIGAGSQIIQSHITDSEVGAKCSIGPFAQLRPGSKIADGVKIGNFVEVKNATVGDGTSLAHLSYLGDIDIGKKVNVGCGVVSVNYDGRNKNRSNIGDYSFIGCNSNIIAPVSVGEGAYVAAATTLTEDVPPDALSIGRVRQQNKPGMASGRYKALDGVKRD